jgi:hypothetical protein
MIKQRIANEASRDFFIKRLMEAPLDKPLWAEVKIEAESITDKQRRLFFKWMTEAAEQTGYEKDNLAYEMKEMFLPSIQRTLMNKATANERKSIMKLTIKEMSEFMDRVGRWCNIEMGITLTFPEDMHRR